MTPDTVSVLFTWSTAFVMTLVAVLYTRAALRLRGQSRIIASGIALWSWSVAMRHYDIGPLYDLALWVLALTYLMHMGGAILIAHPHWRAVNTPWVTGTLMGIAVVIASLIMTIGTGWER